ARSRPVTTTCAPSRPNAIAIARPIPAVDPVTSARSPSKRIVRWLPRCAVRDYWSTPTPPPLRPAPPSSPGSAASALRSAAVRLARQQRAPLDAGGRDEQRVLELRRARPVTSRGRPTVGPDAPELPRTFVDHRFDREGHAGLEHEIGVRVEIVRHGRRGVE